MVSIIVSPEDIELNQLNWSLTGNGYVSRSIWLGDGKQKNVTLHRVVLSRKLGRDLLPNELVDHIDGNKQNNTRSNLRVASAADNARNSKKQGDRSSEYKGVRWDKSRNKWLAGIEVSGKSKTIGRFELEIDAAKAYNTAALKYFGEYARLNIIND